MADLNDLIDLHQCTGLNVAGDGNVRVVFQAGSSALRSDTDSQLILKTFFRSPVKLAAVSLVGVAGEEPTIVKLWCNKKEISFDDVDSEKPHFESAVGDSAAKGAPLALPAVKLPVCSSVTMFLDAEGKDTGESGTRAHI